MNLASKEKRKLALHLLVEGNTIRATSRITGLAYNTVLTLTKHAGNAALKYHRKHVRKVPAEHIQIDELASHVYALDKSLPNAKAAPPVAGLVWTWTAIDSDTRLIISYQITKRQGIHQATNILADVFFRINTNTPQISTDSLHAYGAAIRQYFPTAHYGRIKDPAYKGTGKASLPIIVQGKPARKISTTYIERHNRFIRDTNKRYARRTGGLSKVLKAHEHALATTILWYNFCRPHTTLKTTPAHAAGITDAPYDLDWFEELVLDEYAKPEPRGPYFPPLSPYLLPEI